MTQEIWLVRHGETASNRDGIVQGQTDVPLSPSGLEQSAALGRHLGERPERFDRAVVSPLARARQTLQAIRAGAGERIGPSVEDPAWMESHYGEFEGHSVERLRAWRDEFGEDTATMRPPGGGESMRQMGLRVLESYHRLCALDHERILVVTHGGPISAVVCHLMGIAHAPSAMTTFRRDNTGVTRVGRRANGRWQVVSLNETVHLQPASRQIR